MVVCPVGLRIVTPGYVPPYVHIFVHGPSRICTHVSSMPIETFASVLTGRKSNGCEKGEGVGVGVAVEPGSGPEIFVVIGNFDAVPTTAAAIRPRKKSLILMCRFGAAPDGFYLDPAASFPRQFRRNANNSRAEWMRGIFEIRGFPWLWRTC